MRRMVWCSFAVVGLALTGCGGDGSSQSPVSNDSDRAPAQEVSAISGSCAQLGGFFDELLTLTNQARQNAGMDDLRFSYQLGQAAQGYAEDLATQNFFSHTGKDGSTLRSRIDATGYDYDAAGENLAAGQTAASSVFQGWMASDGHRANILQKDFTEVGFGLFDTTGSSDYGLYWVQNFGKPQGGNSQSGVYIPDDCGFSTASSALSQESAVAGISITRDLSGFDSRTLPGTFQSGSTLQPLGAGTIPVDVLASALSGKVQFDGAAESIPEPAAVLGLSTLGLILWRSRSRAI